MSVSKSDLEVIDAQIHIWKPSSTEHPWDESWRQEGSRAAAIMDQLATAPATSESVIQAMDDADVAGGLLVSHRVYGFDNSYALSVATQHPDRFRVVGILDHLALDVDELVAKWADQPLTSGTRIALTSGPARDALVSGAHDRFFAALQRAGVPLFIYPPEALDDVRLRIVERYPNLQIVIDHFGQTLPPRDATDKGFGDLSDLLRLAEYENVAVKATQLPVFSNDSGQHDDLWPAILAVLKAFGSSRVMWGSDFTRSAASGHLDCRSELDYLRNSERLSPADKEWLLGRALRSFLKWT